MLRFGKRGKLNPRFIGPYEIVSKVGPVAYPQSYQGFMTHSMC